MQQRFMVTVNSNELPGELAKDISFILSEKNIGKGPSPSVSIIPEKAKYYQFKISTTEIGFECHRLIELVKEKTEQLSEILVVIGLINQNPLKRVTVNFEKKGETMVPCEWVLPALEDQKANVMNGIAIFERAIKDYLEGQIDVEE